MDSVGDRYVYTHTNMHPYIHKVQIHAYTHTYIVYMYNSKILKKTFSKSSVHSWKILYERIKKHNLPQRMNSILRCHISDKFNVWFR